MVFPAAAAAAAATAATVTNEQFDATDQVTLQYLQDFMVQQGNGRIRDYIVLDDNIHNIIMVRLVQC
jgi:hypothetical protein